MNIVIGIILFFFLLLLIDKLDFKYKLKFFCAGPGWHKAPEHYSFDGASNVGKCPRCGKKVLQDGNGDWF